jgi:phage-related protein
MGFDPPTRRLQSIVRFALNRAGTYVMNKHTKNLYTPKVESGTVRGQAETVEEVQIEWGEWDAFEVLCGFPKSVRANIGGDLRRMQNGLRPLDSAPMPGVGPGVYELRDEDGRTWYRLIFLKKTAGRIWVLHAFEKRTNRTEQRDIETALLRLKQVRARLQKEAQDVKRTEGTRHNRQRPR